MQLTNPQDLIALSKGIPASPRDDIRPPRLISIWEITQWILPMAPEHLRRVLAAEPSLPQGLTEAEGGTRWFTPAEVVRLRQHFAKGLRGARYRGGLKAGLQSGLRGAKTQHPSAAVVAMVGPQGGCGRSSSLIQLATAAALDGNRVLMIDADPASGLTGGAMGGLAAAFGLPALEGNAGVMALLALTAAAELRRQNELRLDRGEPPMAMAESLAAALMQRPADLIRPTLWPGLDLLAAGPDLMQADLQIISWRSALRGWQPWQALAAALQSEGLCDRYDLILIDTGRGLGPLALAMMTSAEILLAPIPLSSGPLSPVAPVANGLAALGQAVAALQAEAAMTARALGSARGSELPWQQLWLLPLRATPGQLAGFAAKLGANLGAKPGSAALLPNPLPEVPQIAQGRVRNFYDLDYRDLGRQSYAPLRQGHQEAWQGFAAVLQQHWAAPSPAP